MQDQLLPSTDAAKEARDRAVRQIDGLKQLSQGENISKYLDALVTFLREAGIPVNTQFIPSYLKVRETC